MGGGDVLMPAVRENLRSFDGSTDIDSLAASLSTISARECEDEHGYRLPADDVSIDSCINGTPIEDCNWDDR